MSTARFAVLIRGINVGTAKRVAMADLRALLDELGYTAVKTHLNSGNAVVTGPDDDPAAQAARIEEALVARTGVSARVLVLAADHLRAIAAAHPFAEEMAAVEKGGSRMMAHLLFAAPPDGADPAAADPGHVVVGDRVVYQWCPDGLLQSPGIDVGVECTTRNWNTIAKLADLL